MMGVLTALTMTTSESFLRRTACFPWGDIVCSSSEERRVGGWLMDGKGWRS